MILNALPTAATLKRVRPRRRKTTPTWRRRDYPNQSFDFLGYAFRARKTIWHGNLFAHSFLPAASPQALKATSRTIRRWTLHHRSDKSLENLGEKYNPLSKAGSTTSAISIEAAATDAAAYRAYLIRWARGKFKGLRAKGVRQWLAQVRHAKPTLVPHWRFFNVGSRTSEAVRIERSTRGFRSTRR